MLTLSQELAGHIPAFIDALDRGYREDYVAALTALPLVIVDQVAVGANFIQSCNDDFDDFVDAEQHAYPESDLISRDLTIDLLGVSSVLCERFAKSPLTSDSHRAAVS